MNDDVVLEVTPLGFPWQPADPFGGWPWPTDDPVHPRHEGRFARYPDGRVERAAG